MSDRTIVAWLLIGLGYAGHVRVTAGAPQWSPWLWLELAGLALLTKEAVR